MVAFVNPSSIKAQNLKLRPEQPAQQPQPRTSYSGINTVVDSPDNIRPSEPHNPVYVTGAIIDYVARSFRYIARILHISH